ACLRISSLKEHSNMEVFVYSGPHVMRTFFSHIEKEHDEINTILSRNEAMFPLMDEENEEYRAATRCKNCDGEFVRGNYKVRHHDHMTGHFIATVCNTCNLQLKLRKSYKNGVNKFFVPVIAHNLRGYDGHLIVKHLQKEE